MSDLIDDLLELSRIARSEFRNDTVVEGDARLLRPALKNLLSKIKCSRARENAQVEFGAEEPEGAIANYVRDNGVGFAMLLR
ncbi:MAG: hypothetical protein IH987_07295 [Planctomycetes bacterium]|nr:hypothetical protein [Planctomycetota bacterium]